MHCDVMPMDSFKSAGSGLFPLVSRTFTFYFTSSNIKYFAKSDYYFVHFARDSSHVRPHNSVVQSLSLSRYITPCSSSCYDPYSLPSSSLLDWILDRLCYRPHHYSFYFVKWLWVCFIFFSFFSVFTVYFTKRRVSSSQK